MKGYVKKSKEKKYGNNYCSLLTTLKKALQRVTKKLQKIQGEESKLMKQEKAKKKKLIKAINSIIKQPTHVHHTKLAIPIKKDKQQNFLIKSTACIMNDYRINKLRC